MHLLQPTKPPPSPAPLRLPHPVGCTCPPPVVDPGTPAARVDLLLVETVELLLRAVAGLGAQAVDGADDRDAAPMGGRGGTRARATPAPAPIAADAARLTAAVAQLVRAVQLHAAPAKDGREGQAAASLIAMLEALDDDGEDARR